MQGYVYATEKSDFTHLGCLVHSRRKAIEAKTDKNEEKSRSADELVALYGKIFSAEAELIEKFRDGSYVSDDDYVEEPRSVLVPLFDDLHSKLIELKSKALPKSRLAVAVNYPLERWDSLLSFLDYSYATSSNQTAENAIRPFAVARKNFLFCITPMGAEVSALFFSLVESCKTQGIDTEDYLTYLFSHAENVPEDDEDAWTALLPGKVDLSEVTRLRDEVRKAEPDPDRRQNHIFFEASADKRSMQKHKNLFSYMSVNCTRRGLFFDICYEITLTNPVASSTHEVKAQRICCRTTH